MVESRTALRHNAEAVASRAPAFLVSDCGVVLGDQPTDPAQFPELYRQRAVWRRFSPAVTDGALLLDTPDDSLPYLLADNVLQHCPRLSVVLTNWIRAVKPGGLVAFAVPDGSSAAGEASTPWSFATQEPSAPERHANLLELVQTVCHMATLERLSRRQVRRDIGSRHLGRRVEPVVDVVLRKRERTLTPVQSNHSPEAQTLLKVADGAIKARGKWRDLREFQAILDSGVQQATVVDLGRLYLMYQWLLRTLPLSGDCIEVGSYRGGTAKLVSELFLRRNVAADIHVFDTFAGMPDNLAPDEIGLKGTFTETSLAQVQSLLGNNQRVNLHPGLFPRSIPAALEGAQFRFAHIDVDTEQSVRDCLDFIYPRMHPKGVIIIDDYGHPECPGATRATETFFADKPQEIVQMPLVSSAVVLMGC
jgi:O-methyltransferase